MYTEELLGLWIGIATLAVVIGYLANIYFHPQRFGWLDLPQTKRRPFQDFTKSARSHRDAA